jgi:hypothetical protein
MAPEGSTERARRLGAERGEGPAASEPVPAEIEGYSPPTAST